MGHRAHRLHVGARHAPKPIIDIAVRVEDVAEFEHHRGRLEHAGWRLGSRVRTHPVMVFEQNGVRTRIAHFFTIDQWEGVNQRIFRDWLIPHSVDARRYEQVKITAEAAAQHDRGTYNAAKTAIVQEIVDRARAERGMPSVPVYDKLDSESPAKKEITARNAPEAVRSFSHR